MNQTPETTDQQILDDAIRNIRTRLSCYLAIQVKHGSKQPLEGVISSCRQQLDAFLWLRDQTDESNDIGTVECESDWLEAIEKMVVYETEAFYLYEKLLAQPLNPQLRDTLCRAQAAIYQHHLPLLRREISALQATDPVALMDDIKEIIKERDPAQWARFFCGPRGALAGGALLGAGAFWLLKDQINLKTKE